MREFSSKSAETKCPAKFSIMLPWKHKTDGMYDHGFKKMNHMVFTVFRAFLEHEPPVAAVRFKNSTKKEVKFPYVTQN